MAEFIRSFFADRYILLKEEWLDATLRFLQSRYPGSKSFSDVQLANLVFEQWKCASFEKTSFATFSNHGIQPSTSKMELTSPLVCQIDSIIDVGTSYYSQICRLEDKEIEDNTGFEKLFHEKEDDNDQKSSRLLKLTLSDGETTLNAIEIFKAPQLSLYIKPGCKLLIYPPCTVRKGGTFLLKSTNCQILGGEVLPLLNSQRPLDKYKLLVDIKETSKTQVTTPKPPVNRTPVTPATSFDPDYFPDSDDFEMQEVENAPPPAKPFVTVSSLSSRLPSESAIYTSPVRKKLKQSTLENVVKSVGMLTSQKNDIKDDMLENMIEEDEEPISCPTPIITKVKPFTPIPAPVTLPPPKPEPKPTPLFIPKTIKKEIEEDDDIEIIEIETPSSSSSDKKLSMEERLALKNFDKVNRSTLETCQRKMKFCIGARRFWVICIVDDVVEPLRVVDNLWTMKLRLTDVSGQVECFLDNSTLEGLIGYTCQEAIEIRRSSDMERRKDGKRRLEALQNQVQRLDLIFEIEFFASNTSIPVVRKMKTLAEQLDAY